MLGTITEVEFGLPPQSDNLSAVRIPVGLNSELYGINQHNITNGYDAHL